MIRNIYLQFDRIMHARRGVSETRNQVHHNGIAAWSEREQHEALLAIEAAPDGIWISDPQRRIVLVNQALERLIGQPRDQLIGQRCCTLLHVQRSKNGEGCSTACPLEMDSQSVSRTEGWMTSASGETIWVEVSYSKVTDHQHGLIGVMHVIHDLTRRKEVERLKDELLATISHELRTPLQHIKGFASTLLQPDIGWDATTQRDFLMSIDREADRLEQLVAKLLDLSRLEAGQYPLQRRPCAIAELVDGALVQTRMLTHKRLLMVELPEHLPLVLVDQEQIERVLVNLIENAVKYSAPDSPITLTASADADGANIAVVDAGIGIAAEHQQRIFERFYRVGERPMAGSGLGLAICKRIVEAHAGQISVESRPGRGSCFTIRLPREGASSCVYSGC